MRKAILPIILIARAAPAACALLATLAVPAGAEGLSALRRAALSAELHARGVAQGDALLILAAARLRKELDLQPIEARDEPVAAPLTWQLMLEEARALSKDDGILLALAEDVAADAIKGVSSGPVYRIAVLDDAEGKPDSDSAEFTFRGGEYAEVYVEAAPGTALGLTIRDEEGLTVCEDRTPSHIGYCGWTPERDGSFRVAVRAEGHAPQAEYVMMTN